MPSFPKPEKRSTTRGRVKRQKARTTAEIRQYVFARERNICRCCRRRPADSMHEMVSRGRRGNVSKTNSIAVCGDGVNGCHGFLQRYEIRVESAFPFVIGVDKPDAEQALMFTAFTRQSIEWMHLGSKDSLLALISEPMQHIEAAE